mgnify:CR=1 FL=1
MDRITQLTCVALAAALLATCMPQLQTLNHTRVDEALLSTGTILGDADPWVRTVTQLGGIVRSVAANYLWIRAGNLKDEGKHYEANNLARLICMLQPRYPEVWKFQGWNMAFNISVTQQTGEARWRWVNDGLRLLRNRGIPLNPRHAGLYQDLSWIFYFKIGGHMDEQHIYYKKHLAREMHTIIGPPRGNTTADIIAGFARIAQAPPSLNQLLRDRPEHQPAVDALLSAGLPTTGWPMLELIEKAERYIRAQAITEAEVLQAAIRQTMNESDRSRRETLQTQAMAQWLLTPAHAAHIEPIVDVARRQVIIDRLNMDPQRMLQIMSSYNVPLDWRYTHAHGIYWGELGSEMAQNFSQFDMGEIDGRGVPVDLVNARRYARNAVVYLLENGRMTYQPLSSDAANDLLMLAPDLRYIPAVVQAYEEFGRWSGHDNPAEPAYEGWASGFRNALIACIELSWIANRRDQARELYERVRTLAREPDGSLPPGFQMDLDDFFRRSVIASAENYTEAASRISLHLQLAYEAMIAGNDEEANGRMQFARQIHDKYMEFKREDPTNRRQLPPMADIRRNIAERMLIGPFPVLGKSRLWNALPADDRLWLYDRIRIFITPTTARNLEQQVQDLVNTMGLDQEMARQVLAEQQQFVGPQAQAGRGLSFERLFPPPEGLEEFREQQRRRPQGTEGVANDPFRSSR